MTAAKWAAWDTENQPVEVIRYHLDRAEHQLALAEDVASDGRINIEEFDMRLRLGTLHSQLAGSWVGYLRALQ